MVTRRDVLQAVLASGGSGWQQATDSTRRAGPIFEQDLPNLDLSGWSVTAVEVRYAAGATSEPHQHPGFVLGYILEGEIVFQLDGESEHVYRVGDMFYEPPGSVHLVSGNASATRPARMLAMVFAEKGVARRHPA
jgi:quercetin dioxygenase-like cupin family protein